jgi:hypothetical protein
LADTMGWDGRFPSSRRFPQWLEIDFSKESLEVLENLMFAHKVTMFLKPNYIARFGLLMEQQVIPTLRNQNGFQDVLTFFAPGEDAVNAVSLWDSASNAEIYSRTTYHEALKGLATLFEGTPTSIPTRL